MCDSKNCNPLRILFIDDNPARHEGADDVLSHDVLDHAWSYADALELLRSNKYDVVYIDHDLNDFESSSMYDTSPDERRELTGYDIAQAAVQYKLLGDTKVIVHSWNPVGARNIVDLLKSKSIDVRWQPFNF